MSPTARDEQREATRARILTQARALFGERGFERATIRAIAEAAQVDPGLVMHYFGSKQQLFTSAVRAAPEPEFGGTPAELVDFLVDTLRLKLAESGQQPMAMLRSMLTHPPATERARDIVGTQGEQIATAIPLNDAQVRGALITSLMLGLRVGRDLLELPALVQASNELLLDLTRPAIEALIAPRQPAPNSEEV